MTKKGRVSGDEEILARNRRAGHEYHLLDRYEAGVVLSGTEVKSCRAGKINVQDAYVQIKRGEAFLINAHVSPYSQGHRDNPDPERTRKLLLHAREIRKLEREADAGGTTIVPLRVYLKAGRVKIELAVARGRKTHDKRDAIREKDARREMERARGARR